MAHKGTEFGNIYKISKIYKNPYKQWKRQNYTTESIWLRATKTNEQAWAE